MVPGGGPWLVWPDGAVFFSTGRIALLRAVENCGESGFRGDLHVPSYFCPEVITYLQKAGIRTNTYDDSPLRGEPEWSTIACRAGDIVLALNYFGVREGTLWRRWQQAQRRVALIEDHTHDPFSPWARESGADYAIASIRKLYPIPDGGVLWSPAGRPVSLKPSSQTTVAAGLKYAAMKLQQRCIQRSSDYCYWKPFYRSFQIAGEYCFRDLRRQGMTDWSRALVGRGVPQSWRDQRRENIVSFLTQEPVPGAVPLFDQWPADACPFQVVLLFETGAVRDHIRRELIKRRIYCPVHWIQTPKAPAHIRLLGSRLLTVPADQRYGPEEMRLVNTILRKIVRENSPAVR
jgi:hypothetical protein